MTNGGEDSGEEHDAGDGGEAKLVAVRDVADVDVRLDIGPGEQDENKCGEGVEGELWECCVLVVVADEG